jgi:hypothetical protein
LVFTTGIFSFNMQRLLACSIFNVALAQDCDICQGNSITQGAQTRDGHDCVEAIPFCEDNLAFCGGDCPTAQMVVGLPCCPPEAQCDICQGRPIIEGASLEGGHSCTDTVPFCNIDPAGCGAPCGDLVIGIGMTCCPPPDIGPCSVCQGRPMLDVVLESGYSCADTVPFCNDNAAQCLVGSCEELEAGVGSQCCPPDASETPSDASETPSDASETPSESDAAMCDICQGRPIIDFTLETGYTCADSVPYCVGNAAACGGTCEELQVTMGTACCPAPVSPSPAPAPAPAPVPAPAPALASATTEPPREQPREQPTEQPIQQQSPATEDDDGFNSGAFLGANAKLTTLLVMTVSRLLYC